MNSITDKEKQSNEFDITKLLEIIKEKKIILISIILFCLLISTIVAYMLPKSYQSTALVRVKTTNIINENLSSNVSPNIYLNLMKSKRVSNNIINVIDDSDIENKNLIKDSLMKNVKFINERYTDLIKIITYGKTPEEAQFVGETVLKGLNVSMTEFNKLNDENEINEKLAIQVIDVPNLSNVDTTNRKVVIFVGFIISIILVIGYCIYFYSKKYNI